MVEPGTFVLHDAVRPSLPDGSYTLRASQAVSAPGAAIPDLQRHLLITGPRFALPPDQVLSTFPPNDAVGDFSTRLPQIVLRRRTLPWERRSGAAQTDAPWLALVVIADGEGQLLTGQPAGAGMPDPQDRDADTCTVLRVSERVVGQVFPRPADLSLLCHVREVDIVDTELAMGDDDGWVAVVLANRIPQPGIRYTACLVSLEGQLDLLTSADAISDFFTSVTVYSPAGQAPLPQPVAPPPPSPRPAAVDDAWSVSPDVTAAVGVASDPPAPTVTGTSQFFGLGIGPVIFDPDTSIVDFTVLTHWSFTCADGGDFASLLQGLDVGALGTLPPADAAAPPATRPDLTVTDTGHVEVSSVSRRAETRPAWYRGPLTPRQVLRSGPDAAGVLPLLHTADQARRVGPDGREDLSLATAFEMGRLLAVSQPSIVAALLGWRRDGFGAHRLQALLTDGSALSQRLLTAFAQSPTQLSGVVAAGVLAQLGADSATMLGPVRPPDPTPVVAGITTDVTGTLARGLGLDPALAAQLVAGDPGAALPVDAVASTLPDDISAVGVQDFAHLAARLAATVAAAAQPPPSTAPGGTG
jgi:hypothetical protein